jgi:hypothetical protein
MPFLSEVSLSLTIVTINPAQLYLTVVKMLLVGTMLFPLYQPTPLSNRTVCWALSNRCHCTSHRNSIGRWTRSWTLLASRTVRVFRQKFTLEDAIGSHACSLEANTRVTNGIPLGSSLLLPVDTVNCVQTLKVDHINPQPSTDRSIFRSARCAFSTLDSSAVLGLGLSGCGCCTVRVFHHGFAVLGLGSSGCGCCAVRVCLKIDDDG